MVMMMMMMAMVMVMVMMVVMTPVCISMLQFIVLLNASRGLAGLFIASSLQSTIFIIIVINIIFIIVIITIIVAIITIFAATILYDKNYNKIPDIKRWVGDVQKPEKMRINNCAKHFHNTTLSIDHGVSFKSNNDHS